jgi:hypothetical protein
MPKLRKIAGECGIDHSGLKKPDLIAALWDASKSESPGDGEARPTRSSRTGPSQQSHQSVPAIDGPVDEADCASDQEIGRTSGLAADATAVPGSPCTGPAEGTADDGADGKRAVEGDTEAVEGFVAMDDDSNVPSTVDAADLVAADADCEGNGAASDAGLDAVHSAIASLPSQADSAEQLFGSQERQQLGRSSDDGRAGDNVAHAVVQQNADMDDYEEDCDRGDANQADKGQPSSNGDAEETTPPAQQQGAAGNDMANVSAASRATAGTPHSANRARPRPAPIAFNPPPGAANGVNGAFGGAAATSRPDLFDRVLAQQPQDGAMHAAGAVCMRLTCGDVRLDPLYISSQLSTHFLCA